MGWALPCSLLQGPLPPVTSAFPEAFLGTLQLLTLTVDPLGLVILLRTFRQPTAVVMGKQELGHREGGRRAPQLKAEYEAG